MKSLLFATAAAVALCVVGPAKADEPVLLVWGVTQAEFDCLSTRFMGDTQYHTLLSVGQHDGDGDPDPIAECHIPDVRVAGAMDTLMRLYHDNHGGTSTWIESNCHAEAAIPRNKWVCTEGDVTREYRAPGGLFAR